MSIGDLLTYSDSIYEVIEINQNSNLVRLKRTSGVATPGIYTVFNYYQDPFRSKIVNVRFGVHEYNIIYIKGIAEASNLLGDTWSTPVKFASDELILNGTTGQSQVEFINYYNNYIVDWGANMIAEAKEHKIHAWHGKTPNAPVLIAEDFRVVQINTQINAAIDTTDVKNTAAEIESTKSQINSLKSTIAAQKTDLQSAADLYTYNSIQQQISTNTTDLNNLQVTYTSLVDSFQTIVKENSAVLTDPKYHIRGFFPIPALKYYDEAETVAEQIIGFDICYRYIKEDSTSTQLNTFTYTDSDGVNKITGTFTDWNIVQGPMREKIYDDNLQRYVWRSENIADGTETNINQIDIAISNGEKVEFKVRSISEAGYPENPLKSEWSNSVIIEFPPTLSTSNEIADLIKMINDDALQITINNILDSIGITVHLNDVVANTNSVTGEYYKHLAKSIAYEEKKIENGITTVNSISLQDKFDEFNADLKETKRVNQEQTERLDEYERIQREEHAAFDSSLDTIFYVVDTNIKRIDRELAGKVQIDEYTLIKKNLVLNASIPDNETQVVLKSNEEKRSAGNHLAMRVMEKSLSDQENQFCGVEVAEVYVYPNGKLSDVKVALYSESVRHSNEIETLQKRTDRLDTSMYGVEKTIPTLTKDVSFIALESNFNTLRDEFDEIFVDDDMYVKGFIYLNNKKVKLATGPGEGALYVFQGQTETVLGDVHAKNVFIYPTGVDSGESIDMTTMSDNLNETMTDVTNIEKMLNEIQEQYIDPVISFKETYYTLTSNEIHADSVVSTPSLRILDKDSNTYASFVYVDNAVHTKYFVDANSDYSEIYTKDLIIREPGSEDLISSPSFRLSDYIVENKKDINDMKNDIISLQVALGLDLTDNGELIKLDGMVINTQEDAEVSITSNIATESDGFTSTDIVELLVSHRVNAPDFYIPGIGSLLDKINSLEARIKALEDAAAESEEDEDSSTN